MKIIKPNGDVVELSVDEYKALENDTVIIPKEQALLIVPKKDKIKRRRTKRSRWTKEEDDILKSNHSKKTMRRLLPHRTNMAINTRIKVLRGFGYKIVLNRKRKSYVMKSTDGRISMMKQVAVILKGLRKKQPYIDITILRKKAFQIYKDNKVNLFVKEFHH